MKKPQDSKQTHPLYSDYVDAFGNGDVFFSAIDK
jgi:hypothetical protein